LCSCQKASQKGKYKGVSWFFSNSSKVENCVLWWVTKGEKKKRKKMGDKDQSIEKPISKKAKTQDNEAPIAVAKSQSSKEPLEAWYMDNDTTTDQREEHRQEPNQPCSMQTLASLGVLYWKMDADNFETDPELQTLRDERGYDYHDIIEVSPTTLPGYEDKIKTFYEEHIHEDEEIRYCLAGSGYFDIRDLEDRWIRILVNKGDMIVLPEGSYHRFTLDTSNYIKAMRLFQGEPIWTPFNRPQEENASRQKYLQTFSNTAAPEEKCEA